MNFPIVKNFPVSHVNGESDDLLICNSVIKRNLRTACDKLFRFFINFVSVCDNVLTVPIFT